MKYINKYLPVALLMLVIMSCEDDFLQRDNPQTLSYNNFYSTEEDFQASLTACYLSLKGQVNQLLNFNDLMTDNAVLHKLGSTSDEYFFTIADVPAFSSTIRNLWASGYSSIAYANIVISRIKDSQVTGATREVFIKEAKFIRAYSYFNLVRIYGDVPKYEEEITEFSSLYEVGRSKEDEIYSFIIKDLKDVIDIDSKRSAEQLAEAKGKATSLAAKALLGKVYLQSGDYENAVTILTDVVNNSGLELEENLEDLYDPDNPFNKEVLFAINYERVSGQNSPFTYWTLPKFSTGILPNVTAGDHGAGLYNIEPATFLKFSSKDKRKLLIDSAYSPIGGNNIKYYHTKKYLDLNTTANVYSASDFIVLRYADVLLTLADALNQLGRTGDAYQYIDQVRNRAGLNPLPAGYSKDQMNNALANERQKEFILEGDRWFDLSYRGFDYLQKTLNDFYPNSMRDPDASIQDYEVLFPLPAEEVMLKPDLLIQNPGY